MTTVIAFILIFGALVFFHELGHLYFAKRAGILCREFAIGFGPKVFNFTRNETLYTIRLLPLGGFVRMAGEDPEVVDIKAGARVGLVFNKVEQVEKIVLSHFEKYASIKMIEIEEVDLEHKLFIKGYEENNDIPQLFYVHEKAMIVQGAQETQIAPYNRQFNSKTLGQRGLAIFAGPMMNFLLAIVILIGIGMFQGIPVDKAIIGKVTADGAAQQAGLKQGDKVLAIDGKETQSWQDIVSVVQEHPNQAISFSVDRGGEKITIPVTPKPTKIETGQTIGLIGMYKPMEKSLFGSVKFGFVQTYEFGKNMIMGLGQLVTGKISIDNLSGPVGIYNYTEQFAKSGIFDLLQWAAFLSINLGIVNLLPLPALDGGRLLFFAIEAVRGKPVDRHKESMVHFIGFALLMLLMVIVTWNDIKKFFL